MTCALCGTGPITGLYRDAAGRPVHYLCKAMAEPVAESPAPIQGKLDA